MFNQQQGFSLIELMIALALGTILTTTAISSLIIGQRHLVKQKGLASLQESASFGLNYLIQDIQKSNLNLPTALLRDTTLYGGVVLTSHNAHDVSIDPMSSIASANLPTTITLAETLLSQSGNRLTFVGNGNEWTGRSNVQNIEGIGLKSDQLVIQYRPAYQIDNQGTATTADDQYVGGFDCESNKIEFPITAPQRIYVQRYFLREDHHKIKGEQSSLVLACDAGYYEVADAQVMQPAPTKIIGFGGAGQIVIKRAEHFRVLLGVQAVAADQSTHYQYVSIQHYMKMPVPRPRILSIQLGVLVRSTEAIGASSSQPRQTFTVLDQKVQVQPSIDSQYRRQVISQTIALRNAFGARE